VILAPDLRRQVIGASFSAVMGFNDEAASKQATTLIKKAVKKLEK
jgi:hypothetical protein